MWRARLALVLVLALGLTVMISAPVQAQAVRVIVDGTPVFFDQPPVTIGGRVLVPLRGVFERLGAFVQWNPGTRSILAVRGSDQVELTIGSRMALVNGQQVVLDVPPQIIGSRTLVPLRFVSEALGARVDWQPATRVVLITSGTLGQPAPPPPPIGQPPVPGPSVIEGSIIRVDQQNQRLFVQRGDQVHSIVITSNTAITRTNVETGQVGAIGLADLRVGDTVTVTMGANSQAILVRAQTRSVSGRIETVAGAGRTIVLANGQVYTISDDVTILLDGRIVSRDALRAGMNVTLRLNPQTGHVVEVIAQPTAQQPPSGQVRITAFTHNATRPLREGDVLRVEMRGTPNGQATFDIFNVASAVPMREVDPGVYRGQFTVQNGLNVANGEILGHLRVGGQSAVVAAGTNVTIDTSAPVVTARFPQPGTAVNNQRPNIVILLADQGSGIDPQATRLMVNGQNVTGSASISETAINYVPPSNLPAGTVTVRAAIRDRAQNQTNDQWTFNIGVVQGSLIRAVNINPSTPLQAGQTLTVTAVGEPGSQASFTIEGIQQNIPMVEVSGQPGVFVGQFVVQPQHVAQNARIFVTMSRGGQTQTVEATSRLSLTGQQGGAPTISAPTEGSRVGAPIVISGTAVPGSQVIVRVDYRGTLLLFNLTGTYGEVRTTANASGAWQVSINPTIRIPNATLTITAVVIDPAGRRSPPTTVTVTQN